jgi:DNA-binding IclR family transcriptional regulator
MPRAINSLEKGLDILSCFDPQNNALSAQAISERLGIPLSTTYRYLETLKAKDFLGKNGMTGEFELGFMLLRLGEIVSSQMKLGEIVLPHMKSLSSLSGETVLLTALNGWEAICLEKVEPQKLIKLSLERGRSFPLYAGASSKILLAYQNNSYIDSFLKKVPLVGFTRNTITDPAQLRKELKAIRKQGYSFSDQEADPGARAIGAPIFDHRGKIVAGLSIAGPRDRITEKNRAKLIQLVKETAEKVSGDLGNTGSNESTD